IGEQVRLRSLRSRAAKIGEFSGSRQGHLKAPPRANRHNRRLFDRGHRAARPDSNAHGCSQARGCRPMGLGGTMAVQALSRRSLLAGAVSGVAFPGRAQPVVSTALVLAADISSSVNRERFELQRKGYADTFTDAQVIRAIRDTAHGCIGVCYLE